jgi:hypothetical protein
VQILCPVQPFMTVQNTDQPYLLAQTAMAQLKSAVHMVLSAAAEAGLRNSDISRLLGIYMGPDQKGRIPRKLLEIMEAEGVAKQDEKTEIWRLILPVAKDQ